MRTLKRSVAGIALVGALGLLVAGCGTNAAKSPQASASIWAELPAGAAEALANYSAAVLAADGEAMLNYVTDDFAFVSYGTPQPAADYATTVTNYYASFNVEVLGDPMVLGGGDTYIVAQPERVTTPDSALGFSVFRLDRVDGVWLVAMHRFTGE